MFRCVQVHVDNLQTVKYVEATVRFTLVNVIKGCTDGSLDLQIR